MGGYGSGADPRPSRGRLSLGICDSAHRFFRLRVLPLATLLATLFFVREAPQPLGQAQLRETAHALKTAARSRAVWIVAGFLFVWNFSPLFGTPLLYYERDILQFSKIYIGTLGALTNAAGMIGALIFFSFSERLLRRLLGIAVTLGVLSTLSFLGLTGPRSAVVIFLSYGLISQITHLAVLDLAARSCPARVEGTVFALLMSALNLGRSGSQALGGCSTIKPALSPWSASAPPSPPCAGC